MAGDKPPLVTQTSYIPTNKVTAGTVFGSFLAVLAWIDNTFMGDIIPGPVELAMVVLGYALAGYIVKDRKN
jgi:hypothetical protein